MLYANVKKWENFEKQTVPWKPWAVKDQAKKKIGKKVGILSEMLTSVKAKFKQTRQECTKLAYPRGSLELFIFQAKTEKGFKTKETLRYKLVF